MKDRKIHTAMTYIIPILVIVLFIAWWFLGSARMNRMYRDIMTDHLGGAKRTVEVYTNDGKLLKTYSGIIDVKDTSGVDGETELLINQEKRVSIINGIVIIEDE